MLDAHTATSLNFLSLERLIEALEERLEQIFQLANSNSETSILEADELLSKDLVFEKRVSDHLIQHEMPPMIKGLNLRMIPDKNVGIPYITSIAGFML